MKNQLGGSLKVARFALIFAALCATAESQTSKLTSQAAHVVDRYGQSQFETSCAVCHGLDGGGGEHAPSIGRGSAAKSKSDPELVRILRDGLPEKGMPPFNSLGGLRLRSVVHYLRFLQAKNESQPVAGNPEHGRQLFFGQGECANCHAVHGDGHFLSTDLSDFALDHEPSDIRAAIINPKEEAPVHTLAHVMTNTGQEFAGIIRNESNSSLQLQNADGQFYLLMKSALRSVKRSAAPAMPDYRNRLSTAEIDDLVSYIVQQSPSPENRDSRSNRQKKKNQTE
jgi:putative heme-binding domain-containing protein